jgi:thymidylate synthase ThyX
MSDIYQARVVLDSISPYPGGRRLTTMVLTYPRFIHSELLTHRAFARNSASSRAIPWEKMRAMVDEHPVIPLMYGMEQGGMQTAEAIPEVMRSLADAIWNQARQAAMYHADRLSHIGKIFNAAYPDLAKPEYEDIRVHKSLCNRITEPWMPITVVVTATEWQNFFRLRVHPDAEIHFQKIAGMCKEVYDFSKPQVPPYTVISPEYCDGEKSCPELGEYWHLPFVIGAPDQAELLENEDISLDDLKRISVARCARVSYLTHDGIRDPKKDIGLFDRLMQGSGFGHYSPLEHVCKAMHDPQYRSGPFFGWHQFRKDFPLENTPG